VRKIDKQTLIVTLPFIGFFTVLTLWVSGNGFFWDTILLSSKYAHWFIETNFTSFILPKELDAIHPPTFGLYLAVFWKIFDKSLFVSHIAMLPFLLGIVWQVYLLSNFFFQKKHLFLVILFVLADTTFLGQSTLVSPDVALVFFFLLSVTSILYRKRLLLIAGLFCLSFISIRGMFAAVAIYSYDIWLNNSSLSIKLIFKTAINRLIDYIPMTILVLVFLYYHYKVLGYIIPKDSTNWTGHYDAVGLKGIIYNIGILSWRLVDFGRIFIYLFLAAFMMNYLRKRFVADQKLKLLIMFFVLFILINSPYLLFFKQPILHRYLMTANIFCSMILLYILFESGLKIKLSRWIYVISLAGLISGNFWIYPDHIAKGWDSTLAHLPWYKIRTEMIRFIETKKIPIDQVGTEFPNKATFENIDLNGRNISFPEKNMQVQPYIFYSNIFNDFSDQELNDLKTNWIIIKEIKRSGVKGVLYKRK
jgi:hypothetical protein